MNTELLLLLLGSFCLEKRKEKREKRPPYRLRKQRCFCNSVIKKWSNAYKAFDHFFNNFKKKSRILETKACRMSTIS